MDITSRPTAPDPLLAELRRLVEARNAIDHTIRVLVAYGREFTRPRPYRLADLADAAGMSISGIRTAYGHDEITEIAGLLDRRAGHSTHTATVTPLHATCNTDKETLHDGR